MSGYPGSPNDRWPAASPSPAASNGAAPDAPQAQRGPHLSDEQLAAWAGHELPDDERVAVQRHLGACRYCQRALEQTQHIRALARATASNAILPANAASVADRVLARLPNDGTGQSPPSPARGGEHTPPIAPQSRRNRREFWRRMGALAAVLLLIAASALLFARISPRSQTGKPVATITPTPAPTAPILGNWAKVLPAQASILDVAVVSPTDIWAAGTAGTNQGIETLLMHFDGVSWQVSPDIFEGAQLYSVSMTSASEGWASGSRNGAPLLLHYSDGHWSDATTSIDTAALKDHKIILTSVRMASAQSGWALGQGDQQPQPTTQVLQYMRVGGGYRWEPTQSFAGATLNALSVVSDHEAWIAGEFGQKTFIVRVTVTYLNGGPASIITGWETHGWDVGSGRLDSVSMFSSTDGWAGGADSGGLGTVFHWDGSQWRKVGLPPSSNSTTVQGIVAAGANTAWVYGEFPNIHSSFLYSVAGDHWLDFQFSPTWDSHLVTGAAISPLALLAITDGANDYGANPAPALYDLSHGVPLSGG